MKLTNEIHCIDGKKYHVFQSKLKDIMYSDSKGNPILWFAKELHGDWLVLGLDTKRETLDYIKGEISK